MKKAYSTKEITDALEWAQNYRRHSSKVIEEHLLVVIEDVLDDALEDANAREKWEKENEPKPDASLDLYETTRWIGTDGKGNYWDPIKGTGFQPEEEEDRPTATIVRDIVER